MKVYATKEDFEQFITKLEGVFDKKLSSELQQRDRKIAELESKVKHLEWQNDITNMYREHHARLIDDQKQYSKNVNILIDGIPCKHNETNEGILDTILDEIDRMNLHIDDVEVDRAHRFGPIFTDKYGKKHQTVICRFTTWSARDIFYQARKRSFFSLSAALTERRQKFLDSTRERLAIEDSRKSKLI